MAVGWSAVSVVFTKMSQPDKDPSGQVVGPLTHMFWAVTLYLKVVPAARVACVGGWIVIVSGPAACALGMNVICVKVENERAPKRSRVNNNF